MRDFTITFCFTTGALLLWGSAPARAQLTATPESLRVVLTQGEDATAAVTLTSGGASAVPFCLDFDRPLQRSAGGGIGTGCGEPGELLAVVDGSGVGGYWEPRAPTMTPDGRLFVAEFGTYGGGANRYGYTTELTADLQFVRRFRHPAVAELASHPVTEGVTYDAEAGSLWWTNAENAQSGARRVLLLEGTLDGVPTGRRVNLPIVPTPYPFPVQWGYPKGANYDPATRLFYYTDGLNNTLWAIDINGVVPEGYPLRLARYPGTYYIGDGVDAFGGAAGGPEGVRLEIPIGLELDNDFDRVTLTDPSGVDLGVETPLPVFPGEWSGLFGYTLRSRLAPNRVMYAPYSGFGSQGVAAIRPAPLAPSWLSVSAWSGTVPAGGSGAVALTFRAGERAPGEYRSTLVVEDTTGAVLASVPLVLVVEPVKPGTEPGPGAVPFALSVAPNPARGLAAVTLTLNAPARVRLAVFDVLGREVAQLADGPLGAGAHALALDGSALPVGVYVLRAEADGHSVSRPVAVVGR